jgi:hypothetical protein
MILHKDTYLNIVTLVSLLIYATFIPLAIMNKVYGWIPDVIGFAILTIGFYLTYSYWRMNLPIFTIIIIGLLLHLGGIFGWYYISPVPIQWDHLTHFFGCLPFALLFFQFLKHKLNNKFFTVHNFLFFIIIFFAAMGVGALVELSEFWGYLSFGFGPGALMFGPGDGVIGKQGIELIDVLGGGWINKGWDMTFNLLGILVGMIVMMIIHFGFKLGREKKITVQTSDYGTTEYDYSVKL